MAQTLTDIKALLDSHGLRPKHSLGQNFLHDANQMRRILAAAAPGPTDIVLEVGPGTGALSEWILEAGARLIAVEIDRDLEPILRDRVAPLAPDRFELIVDDVLEGKHTINPRVIEALRRAGPASGSTPPALPPFKLIANLPYHVASPLLANLVTDHPAMILAVVMIQREVADRLTAPPGGKDYGPLGVLMQAMCEVDRVATLSPGCFWPQPTIDSAVVRLRRRAAPLTDDPARLAATLHLVFGQRRKQLGAILGRATPLPPGIDPTWRAERLSVEQLVELSRLPL
ncbi:MAG: 16S rRNA (adenine(1518)-N(6)/adenine(1519)-N(6))-dimethyltransferase RsmA [Planctomycetota bacterium]|nr:16S rRNA (adenine(1518)-N(6)/adenine(1519)-N(6))-dimethyltransferase RsmA [Planctomycetota bacterium]